MIDVGYLSHNPINVFVDSPGVPPSATAHELFRGFSYVAPILLDDNVNTDNHNPLDHKSIAHVSTKSVRGTFAQQFFDPMVQQKK